jgi:hypothetical protein
VGKRTRERVVEKRPGDQHIFIPWPRVGLVEEATSDTILLGLTHVRGDLLIDI